jgi:HK97 family phage portal protein
VEIFGFTIARTSAIATREKQLQSIPSTSSGWFNIWPILREPFSGAWQLNGEISQETILSFHAVYACVTLIASDISKMRLRLVEEDANGIWTETQSPAFSPVLRKPNRFQNRIKFIEWWLISKLIHGNTYALKQRDQRGVVTALYILDPTRVRPLIAPDGSVFYELQHDNLAPLTATVTVPARDIIHDIMVPLFHPLVGVSPIYACAIAAWQGLKIQQNSSKFFANGSQPSGVLSAPGKITQETADRIKAQWQAGHTGDNAGSVAVIGEGLKYDPMFVNARDSQLIDQLKWTAETVCSCFHVPPYMIGVGQAPTYNNIEALNQQYYAQCLQTLIESLELCLDEGLELPRPFGTEFDLDDLLRMDSKTLMETIAVGVGAGVTAPNEGRKRVGAKPVPGGESPYLQEQNWPLRLLSERELPARAPTAPENIPDDVEAATSDFETKAMEEGLIHA